MKQSTNEEKHRKCYICKEEKETHIKGYKHICNECEHVIHCVCLDIISKLRLDYNARRE